ncbi:NADP-dependent oxidoreductase domain-containing protein [Kockovaella imperatae]|uniref:NADP-dependent oxidoreductase domain-containing protein n=1 Tax=Kockovaella imperatae TaxID=4999 RepID=A0A1Y1UI68_9TREE|nr:NADP-dependent oxidoreductase domain-containing protein [Kockovaella imperatae]ORX37750.1 NADP-dependent oxidoreductase domain-containing protein [Kockovaella imperatae]
MSDATDLNMASRLTLNSGQSIPRLGLGVYKAAGAEATSAVVSALKEGYRHVDTAQWYENEEDVGQGVRDSGVKRKQVWLTSKYFPEDQVKSTSDVLAALRTSLPKLDHEDGHIDLMLIHSAAGGQEGRENIWRAFAQAQKEGWIQAIGVSNFNISHLERLPGPIPALNQIELHPWCQQRPIVEYCQRHGIAIEAYSPLARAEKDKWEDPVLVKICEKHSKNPGQVLIRWSLQRGFVVIPKSSNPRRIRDNGDVFDFCLDKGDMDALNGLDRGSGGAVTWNPVDQA